MIPTVKERMSVPLVSGLDAGPPRRFGQFRSRRLASAPVGSDGDGDHERGVRQTDEYGGDGRSTDAGVGAGAFERPDSLHKADERQRKPKQNPQQVPDEQAHHPGDEQADDGIDPSVAGGWDAQIGLYRLAAGSLMMVSFIVGSSQ